MTNKTSNSKIHSVGGYSFMVTLPKQWVVEQKLNSGDSVSVEVNLNGNLEIKPAKDEDEKCSKLN